MKRAGLAADLLTTLRMVLWFFGLLFAAEFARTSAWEIIGNLPLEIHQNAALTIPLNVLIWVLAFGAAGALLARAVTRSLALPLAVVLGAAELLPMIVEGRVQPWTFAVHDTSLISRVLGWANWYVPVLASATGAIAWKIYCAARHRRQIQSKPEPPGSL
jgi:hypothetical protein